MTLQEYYEAGLSVDAYTKLLNEDQTDLHQLYERRAEIDPAAIETIRSAGVHKVLIITETWCGDSLAIFPVVARLFAEAGCEIRVVRRDENMELIDRYLTNGGRAIPIVIVLDDEFGERFHWGPRPARAQAIVTENKAAVESGDVTKADVHKMVRAFYARDHGKAIVAEFSAALGG